MKLVLVRHGRVWMHSAGCRKGWLDMPLSRQGLDDAARAAQTLKNLCPLPLAAWSSDLARAHSTARTVLKKAELDISLTSTSLLRERCGGMFDGRPVECLHLATAGGELSDTYEPPGGESVVAFRMRVRTWLSAIAHTEGNCLIAFTHGSVISLIVDLLASAAARAQLPSGWNTFGSVVVIDTRTGTVVTPSVTSATVPRFSDYDAVALQHCNICTHRGHFIAHRDREAARCPSCGALERHRHQWWVLSEHGWLTRLRGVRLLEVGPEAGFTNRLGVHCRLVTLDINYDRRPRPNVVADFCNLPFQPQSFDAVLASHVFEHIRQPDKAIHEAFRVLVPGGFAMFDVPILAEQSQSCDVADSLGHYWFPGWDWFSRYSSAGFVVRNFHWDEVPSSYGVVERAPVTIAIRPA